MARTQDELRQELDNQIAALRASSHSFDAGNEWEARRIATTVCTLLYDRGRTISLLSQMGKRNSMLFLSTSASNAPGNLMDWSPLTAIRATVLDGEMTSKHIPRLDSPSETNLLKFEEWWNETVYENKRGKLTRATLLRTLRDQEGGAHFDSTVSDHAYIDLKARSNWRQIVSKDGVESASPIGQAELATARQISYEVDYSLANADHFDTISGFSTGLHFKQS